MRITPASPEELRAVAEVHVVSWQVAYAGVLSSEYLAKLSVDSREAAWRQVLAEGVSELLVAVEGASVVGFASFGRCRDADAPTDRGELWALYVSPDAWSTGVGQALWSATRARLAALEFRSVSLWVIAGNDRALRFYSRAGFFIEPGSEKEFELGGELVREVRMVVERIDERPEGTI